MCVCVGGGRAYLAEQLLTVLGHEEETTAQGLGPLLQLRTHTSFSPTEGLANTTNDRYIQMKRGGELT